jgi:hypothetical protein
MSDREILPQAELDEAVDAFIRDTGWNEAGALTSWVLVGHQMRFDVDGEIISTYPMVYKGGSLPDHVAMGLIEVLRAQTEIDRTIRWMKTDDD